MTRDQRETSEHRLPLLSMGASAAHVVASLKQEIERLQRELDDKGGPAPQRES